MKAGLHIHGVMINHNTPHFSDWVKQLFFAYLSVSFDTPMIQIASQIRTIQ
jgi:hypothetical protein